MTTRKHLKTLTSKRAGLALSAVTLAFGAIVLGRAQSGRAAPGGEHDARPTPIAVAATPTRIDVSTPEMSGFVALTRGAMLANREQEVFAEVRLEAAAAAGPATRRPVALAVALDTSGSMSGDNIVQARRAVAQLIERMQPRDRIALITYTHEASVTWPLSDVGESRAQLNAVVQRIHASGGTNIPGGLAAAAQALAHAPSHMARRLVLVSDGQDGSGIALSQVSFEVSRRAQEAVTTSALGVGTGYDERWLTTVADAGRGNYEFLAGGGELSRFLGRELEQASTTVADGTQLRFQLPPGWTVAEMYGARMTGEAGVIPIGALFAGERRRVTLRMRVPASAAGAINQIAVGLQYRASLAQADRRLALGQLTIRAVLDEASVMASRDVALEAEAVAQRIDAQQAQAIEAWRDGRREEATRMARDNVATLQRLQVEAPAAAAQLAERETAAQADLDNIVQQEANSAGGRAYGLSSNAGRRSRALAY